MAKYLKNLKQLKTLIPLYSVFKSDNEISVFVSQSFLVFVFIFLKMHINYQYSMLACISGVDLLNKAYRYCVVYELLSVTFNARLRIKVLVSPSMSIYSVMPIFKNANWWEREIWDLFGIYFSHHIGLRRILTDYGFEGNPLKKDFPLSGFTELRYNESKKKVVIEPISLAQEYRVFNFEKPW